MMILAIYLIARAGIGNLSITLSAGESLPFAESIPVMMSAIALVVSYFAGPMLNFGDFARYARTWRAVQWGNFMGLPVNFMFFSILTVLTISATQPVFGELLTDPIDVMDRIGTPVAVIIGGLTFVIATVGINIIANFISSAFDFSNLAPQLISWRAGGMLTAFASVLLTPWNWYNNPTAIHYTLGVLGALIGPLHGILIAGYYLIHQQKVSVPELYSSRRNGRYWYRNGFNPNAVCAICCSGTLAILSVIVPKLLDATSNGGFRALWIADYSWFIGCSTGFLAFVGSERIRPTVHIAMDDVVGNNV